MEAADAVAAKMRKEGAISIVRQRCGETGKLAATDEIFSLRNADQNQFDHKQTGRHGSDHTMGNRP